MADKRTERYVFEFEINVWEEANLSREELRFKLMDSIPIILPDEKGDEAAELGCITDVTEQSAA